MNNLDQRAARVRLVLFVFGIPFVASLAALAFESAVSRVIPVPMQVFEVVAGVSVIGVLATIVIDWIGDRRVLQRQERELQRQDAELTLKRLEIESKDRQHELELGLKRQELEREVEIREERLRVRELEHALKLGQLELERLESGQSGVTPPVQSPGPPASLSRQRRVLAEPGLPAAPDGDE